MYEQEESAVTVRSYSLKQALYIELGRFSQHYSCILYMNMVMIADLLNYVIERPVTELSLDILR